MDEPIRPAQLKFLNDLVAKRDISVLPNDFRERLTNPDWVSSLSKAGASPIIDTLTKLPKKPLPSPIETEHMPVVKPGFYFIVDPTNNEERFFRVKIPKDGKWKGYTFLEVQASDYFHKIRDKAHKYRVLEKIAEDPIEAMNQYGIRLGRCGNCGRTLTAKGSRLKGIGPVCEIELLGQASDEEVALLERLGLI